jgi:serine/threonine protein kinase
VARALRFLHGVATPPIIHQDVKSDNILLDVIQGELVAKLADFGTARYADELLNTGLSKVSKLVTGNVIGSPGYMPEEYQSLGVVSEKTDTYAFGVVLYELLTGSPPISADGEMLAPRINAEPGNPDHVLAGLLDARPGVGEWHHPGASALRRIASRCTARMARQRCIVVDVLPELDNLAGRLHAKLAKRGEEFDPYTGKLIRCDGGHGNDGGAGGAGGGGGMSLGFSDKTS